MSSGLSLLEGFEMAYGFALEHDPVLVPGRDVAHAISRGRLVLCTFDGSRPWRNFDQVLGLVIERVPIHVGPRTLFAFDDVLEVHAPTVIRRIDLMGPSVLEPRVPSETADQVFTGTHLDILENHLDTTLVAVDWKVHPDTGATFYPGGLADP